MRIRGWMGRADQTTKVKGMFVRPEQVAETARHHKELSRLRLVVTRDGEADAMTLKAECAAPSDRLRMIEWVITLKAAQAIMVEKTNHSLFSMRAALDITPKGGGNLVNAEGMMGEKDTAGAKSAWCDFYGKRAAMANTVEGIAIFDHPRNPWAPTQWFTRDYGFASPTPLNWIEKPWTIAAGDSVTFRYAVVLHSGEPASANLVGLYMEWAAKPV